MPRCPATKTDLPARSKSLLKAFFPLTFHYLQISRHHLRHELFKRPDVEVEGFGTGVDVGETEYSVTIDGLRLRGVRAVGLQNNGNALAVRALDSEGSFRAVANLGAKSMIAITQSRIAYSNGAQRMEQAAILNTGLLVHHELALEGSASILDEDGGKTLRFDDLPAWRPAPVERGAATSDPATWLDAAAFGAVPDDGAEDGAALQAALDAAAKSASGTVFLKYGVYSVAEPLRLLPGLKRLIGMNSEIRLVGEAPSLLTTVPAEDRPEEPLFIQDIRLGVREPYLQAGTRCVVEHASTRELVVRDLLMFGPGLQSDHFLLCRLPTGGRVYLDDVCCGRLRLTGSQAVWARQLNTEGQQPRIYADGASLWVLGLKTEGSATVLDATNDASSVIWGGLLYPSRPVLPSTPAFRVAPNAPFAVAIAESAYDPKKSYANVLELSGRCSKCALADLPRGQGRMWVYRNR
jgi:Pectate lyase superfamily protein